MSLDDFPTRDCNSELAAIAEAEFERAVVGAGRFVVQQRDRHDYGTDFQLEAKHSGGMSNFRIHAQLKGTDKVANKDGSVSISVSRTNLNYLLSQPHSLYVCYYSPTRALLVRSAEDVFRDAEHRGEEWRCQDSVTIRFHMPFDSDFQERWHGRAVASSTAQRADRLLWVATLPDAFPDEAATVIPSIVVPEAPDDAANALKSLYERGRDDVISKVFEQFLACLGPDDPRLIFAYLSEINLAMRRRHFDRQRVGEAIEFITASRADNSADALYCRANGHSALGQTGEAKRLYQEAIALAEGDNRHLAAQCWKNLGTEFEQEENHVEARQCYEKAISLSPDLMEAHMALAMAHKDEGDLEPALHHFDQAIWAVNDMVPTLATRGHRLGVYFRLGMTEEAFNDIAVILPHGDQHPWVFDWCALQVYNHARTDNASVLLAIQFWDSYLRMRPKDRRAQKERLLCFAYAKMHGLTVRIDYRNYVAKVRDYLAHDQTDAAYLWDRAGHWAQVDDNWEEAEVQYRKAYSLEPDRYGYCLGTALNHLGKFEDALPMLHDQATTHQPDAMSWFQVAIAQEGTSDIDGAKESYRRALLLDHEYDLAMFNLGGLCWNHGPRSEAIQIWAEAIELFPDHELAGRLRREFPQFFDVGVLNDDSAD